MGCWNATCGLSRLTIYRKEPVYLVFLAKSHERPFGSGMCFATEDWEPISPLIRATYDEYGGVEGEDPVTSALFESWIAPYLVPREQGENSVHQKAIVLPESARLHAIMDHIHGDSHRVVLRLWPESSLGYTLLRADVVDALLLRSESTHLRTARLGFDMDILSFLCGESSFTPRPPEVDTELLKLIRVNGWMNRVRSFWHPGSGAGSQEEDTHHIVLHNIVGDVLARRLVKYCEENGEVPKVDEGGSIQGALAAVTGQGRATAWESLESVVQTDMTTGEAVSTWVKKNQKLLTSNPKMHYAVNAMTGEIVFAEEDEECFEMWVRNYQAADEVFTLAAALWAE